MGDYTAEQAQEWVNRLAATHSAKTVKNAHGFLSAVFKTFRPDLILKPALPQKQPAKLTFPTDCDIKKLIAYLAENDLDMLRAVYLAAFGTLRTSLYSPSLPLGGSSQSRRMRLLTECVRC